MHLTIARLRIWIVALGVVLVAVLAIFLSYARYKAHRIVSDLPGKLGLQIARTSDSYTLSQTGKNGHTAFTIKASKAIQFKDGDHYTLNDVVITLFGAQGDRRDRIAGSEFNLDQKTGIVSAQGEVQIDLESADSTGDRGGKDRPVTATTEAVHVVTSGLIFNQKTQLATTQQFVDFKTPKFSGHATGASYDVQKGLLVLDTKVELSATRDGNPILLHASHAEFLRTSMQAFLLNPLTDYQTDHASSDESIVYFRKDGSADHIDAQGHVHMTTDGGQDMTARAAKILLDPKSQLQRAEVSGGINFISSPTASNASPHQMHGNAVEATVEFGPNGTLHHAQARNAVSFVDQLRGLNGDPQGSATRELRAAQVDVDFSQTSDGHSIADKVLAAGGAAAVLHTIPSKGAAQNTTVKGDQLLATLQNGKAITSLHGTGHTSVLDVSPANATNLSTGDVLQVNFVPQAAGRNPPAQAKPPAAPQPAGLASSTASSEIDSTIQEGNVTITQTPAAGASASAPTHATAHRAEYSAASQLLRLTGSPRIDDGTSDLAATSIDYHRDTSIANATGNVKATYLQPKSGQAASTATPSGFAGQGPTHVISNDAILDQAHGQAIFRGQARLWQGGNSVAAPIIELHRNPETLKAYSDGATPGAVSTVIATASGPQHPASVFRVRSRDLFYTDADHKAVFTGTVATEDASGVVHCDQAEVFLASTGPAPKNPGAADSGQSRIDHIIATGHVVLQQPGRRGTGERLLYTAQDGKFVLTGTSSVPPHLYDQIHGNVSGDALSFNSQDDSVSVTGGRSKAVTDTRTAK